MSSAPMGSPPFGSRERRAARRYDMSLPIVVRVVPQKRSEPCHGRIRDISARGIYFITDEGFTPGAELEFTVALPVEITQGAEVSIHAHSRVLRTEERREGDTARTGVAAVIERIEYIRAEPALSYHLRLNQHRNSR
jgi:PilZ domain-containing protein